MLRRNITLDSSFSTAISFFQIYGLRQLLAHRESRGMSTFSPLAWSIVSTRDGRRPSAARPVRPQALPGTSDWATLTRGKIKSYGIVRNTSRVEGQVNLFMARIIDGLN